MNKRPAGDYIDEFGLEVCPGGRGTPKLSRELAGKSKRAARIDEAVRLRDCQPPRHVLLDKRESVDVVIICRWLTPAVH